MIGETGRKPGRRLLVWALASIMLFLVITLVPVKRYVPICGWPDGHTLRGPMREQYVALLAHYMAEEGFRYFRHRNTILVPIWPVFDGGLFDWIDFQLNFPWKIASNIGEGVTILGRRYPPPEPVLRTLRETEGPYGPYPRTRGSGSVQIGAKERYHEDCNLFRAAVLRVEDMPGPLPDLVAIEQERLARTAPGRAPVR
jgi:hypothetical protein